MSHHQDNPTTPEVAQLPVDFQDPDEQQLLTYYRSMHDDFKAIMMTLAKLNAAASKSLYGPQPTRKAREGRGYEPNH